VDKAKRDFESPVIRLIGSLFLGGLLVGLGAPFWYDTVTGLTNIQSLAKSVAGGGQTAAAPHAPAPQPAQQVQAPQVIAGQVQPPPAQAMVPRTPDRPQPVTPVGAFNISSAAVAAAPVVPV
jgi:hypothetical protein